MQILYYMDIRMILWSKERNMNKKVEKQSKIGLKITQKTYNLMIINNRKRGNQKK